MYIRGQCIDSKASTCSQLVFLLPPVVELTGDYVSVFVVCSAGVGRTGTLITTDIALEQVKAEGVVEIYNIVDKMRHQRPHMIQSQVCFYMCNTHLAVNAYLYIYILQEQYMFIHDAILESITCGNTQVSAADLQRAVIKLKQRDPGTQLTGYEQQFKVAMYYSGESIIMRIGKIR